MPLPETTRLYEAIRKGWAPDPPTLELRKSGRGSAVTLPAIAPAPIPLVGRASEMAALIDDYRRAAHVGRVPFVEGDGGIGKTRRVEEVVARIVADGGTFAMSPW